MREQRDWPLSVAAVVGDVLACVVMLGGVAAMVSGQRREDTNDAVYQGVPT